MERKMEFGQLTMKMGDWSQKNIIKTARKKVFLKSITQTGFNNIRGVNTFKDALVYANPKFNCFTLPTNSASTQLYECFRGGNRVSQLSNGDIAE